MLGKHHRGGAAKLALEAGLGWPAARMKDRGLQNTAHSDCCKQLGLALVKVPGRKGQEMRLYG